VAGLVAEMAQLTPVDDMRFGFRIWTELQTGLVVKLQTLDRHQVVLEQAAFSELQMDAPVKMSKLVAQMDNTQGYQVRNAALRSTTARRRRAGP
jgi:sigma-E factor negative regulatory protein RseB